MFGELALVYSIPRTATVKAATDVEVYVLEKADFEEVRAGSPHLEAAVQKRAKEHFARFQFCLFELAHTPETEPFRADQVITWMFSFTYNYRFNRLEKFFTILMPTRMACLNSTYSEVFSVTNSGRGELQQMLHRLSGKEFSENEVHAVSN